MLFCWYFNRPAGRSSPQSFIEMIKLAKGCTLDDDVDDEEVFLLKKETPSPIREGISIVYINK